MDKKIIELYKCGNLTIPLYLLKNRDKFKLKFDEFIFLMYLYNIGDKSLFDPGKIVEDLGLSLKEVMNYISILTEKRLISVDVSRSDKDILEDRIDLSNFYGKVSLIMVEDINSSKEEFDSSVFTFIEKEFGRTLSPMEVEIIKSWLENGSGEELVREAVKEAVFNGVSNLRYIDKILYEWQKKGIKNKEDVEKNREIHRKKEREEPQEEIFDYNWFEDDDE
ncbi:MAG: DnaD domain protein [Bacilli bacterium]|nr:DnaD domain protein [Bacilli bacterium]